MKINYAMYSSGLTGGVRTFFEIGDRLAARGHEVTITNLGVPTAAITNDSRIKLRFIDKFSYFRRIMREIVQRLYGSESSAELKIINRQLKLLADSMPDCDINVATYCFTAFSVCRSGKGIPFYHLQHYEPLFFHNPDWQKMVRETYHLPLNLITNSSWLKRQLQEKEGIDQVPVINHAIDHRVFYPRKKVKNGERYKIMSLARRANWKGFGDLLAAMKLVRQQRNDVELIIYSSQPAPEIKDDIPYRFYRSPSDNELAELYSNSDLVVSPSWHESFPLPPLEAMACGAPVITTLYGTEDYAFDNVNALVVPPRDSVKMSEAILRLLEDKALREKLSGEGIKTAQKFTWDKTTDQVEKLFQLALNKS